MNLRRLSAVMVKELRQGKFVVNPEVTLSMMPLEKPAKCS